MCSFFLSTTNDETILVDRATRLAALGAHLAIDNADNYVDTRNWDRSDRSRGTANVRAFLTTINIHVGRAAPGRESPSIRRRSQTACQLGRNFTFSRAGVAGAEVRKTLSRALPRCTRAPRGAEGRKEGDLHTSVGAIDPGVSERLLYISRLGPR